MKDVRQFQARFRAWLGPNREARIRAVARQAGYTEVVKCGKRIGRV
jgi:hypothetical protein